MGVIESVGVVCIIGAAGDVALAGAKEVLEYLKQIVVPGVDMCVAGT